MDADQAKIFVGGITWETKEETLKDHFNQFGEVVETVIMRDRNTGSARGFGFVQFSDPSVVDKALKEKHVILGRTVEVKKAVPRGEQHQHQHNTYQQQQQQQNHQQNKGFSKNNSSNVGGNNSHFKTKKIFVGGLSASLTEEEFKGYFEKFGRITDVVVMYDSTTHRPRGFGFITFDSEEAVDNVMQTSFHELNGKYVEVKRAVPKDGNNNNGNNGGGGGGYNMRMGGGGGGGRGSLFGSYQGGVYPPYSPRYGMYSGFAAPPLTGNAYGGGYTYGASGYVGGYAVGGYGAYGAGPILAPRSPWNGPGMVGPRRSPVPYGNAAMFPGYMNAGIMAMAPGGYRGIMGPGANGKWNQGGGDLQVQSGNTSPGLDSEKDDDSSGLTGSYGAGGGKQNQRGPDGRLRPLAVDNSS